jgi:hypothetical protein
MPGGPNDAGHANGGIAWGIFNPTTEGNFGQGTAGVELDTIQIPPGSTSAKGTEEGDFTLSADGNTLVFTPEVPEPSSFAAVAVIGALALLAAKRQFA